jgi:uncharacterized protein YceH (UPF0502 family)
LTAPEIRVLGCLIEKQRVTPDVYPLSLNSLRLACNQTTNREPVVEYDEGVIREAVRRLERHGLARFASGSGSRTPKYRHLLPEALPMTPDEQALMCVLMLRGPQTPGELKQRGERMYGFADLSEVLQTLAKLGERGLVASLGRRPGQKEERYTHLIGEGSDEQAASSSPQSNGSTHDWPVGEQRAQPAQVQPTSDYGRSALEERVERLEREVAELKALIGESEGSPG